jgi:hypothetical protein
VIGQMAENYPTSDWAKIPKGFGNKGSSGLYASGAMCGNPLGAFLVFNMFGVPDVLADAFLRWFEDNPLPTNEAFVDYRSGEWVANFGSDFPLNNAPKVRSGTMSCHGAHTKWKSVSGSWISYHGVNRANHDRCRKSTYASLIKMVQLINDWKAGALPSVTLDPSVAGCKTSGCHSSNGYPVGGVGGKMKCQPCHQTTAGITPGHGG